MKEELLKWLRFAIELEEKGLEFYKLVLAKTRHPRAMELFDFLVKVETGHKRVLTGVFNAVSKGDKSAADNSIRDFMKIENKIPMFKKEDVERMTSPETSLHDMFNRAMGMEEQGIELYTDLAKKEKNPELKRLFTKLARDEVSHRQEIEDLGRFVFGTGTPSETGL